MAFIESGAFAYGRARTESPLRDTTDSAINKQNSDFSLNQADNLDECLLMNGMPLGSMNIDELLSNFCDDEDANQFSSNPNAQTHHQYISINSNQTIENQLVSARQSSVSAHHDFDKKTVEEVVYHIGNPVNNDTTTINRAPPECQHSCDEVTSEDLKVGTMENAPQTPVPLPQPLPLPLPPLIYPHQMATQPPPVQSNIRTPQQIMMPLIPVQSNIGNTQQKMMRQAPTQRNICNPRQMMMPPAPVQRNVGNPQQMMISPSPMQSNIDNPQQMIMPPAPIRSNIGNPQQMMMTPVMIQSNIGNPQQTMMPATSIQSNINNSSGNPVYGMRNMNMGMHRNGMAIDYAASQSNMGNNMVVGSNSYMTYPMNNSPLTAVAADNNVADNNVEMDNIVAPERSSNNYRKRLTDIPVDVTEERKQLRKIKNRAAAVRSRLRKQAYIKELEYEVQYLEEENKKLKETMKELEEKRIQEIIKRS